MILNKRRVVITGAAGSLGQAAAAKAREYGAHVTGLDIADTGQLDNVDAYYSVDLLDPAATRECFAKLGRVDALFNIAGGFAMGDTAFDPDSDQWQRMFQINVDTLRNATMAAVPLLQKNDRGAIVNIGALGALQGQGSMSAYCCAKGSVMKLTESLSDELRADNINVNAVLPSIIDTEANRQGMPDADFSTWVTPSGLAEVMCFLASPQAGEIHGALIPVRGRA
ncbi:SDR family NAD(P)-dependent oxidoreductase [Seongchinamella unica]|uniref:SDR family NAD(P)-dependent oxidoreductase n=1 Tax=Seongchinamella unica TaxID=2547392 RepID=UPI001EED94D8|nr:SDR family NAD(P)-dependent oxidoreductase [Seongchinamella unica]